MIRIQQILLVTICSGFSLTLLADNSVSGKDAYQSCVVCHGDKAEGNPVLSAPALSGQSADYLLRQLQNFKTGLRGDHPEDKFGVQMRQIAATLNDENTMEAVATYITSLPLNDTSKTQSAPLNGDLRRGNNLYQGNCGACHGGKAEGNLALQSPRLSNLDADYLKRQYMLFIKGARGSEKTDRYGRQMRLIANSMTSEQDLHDVISYIHAVQSQ